MKPRICSSCGRVFKPNAADVQLNQLHILACPSCVAATRTQTERLKQKREGRLIAALFWLAVLAGLLFLAGVCC
jgi:hypothetical protein